MKKLLLTILGVCGCLNVLGTPSTYQNPGVVAPTFTFTAASSGDEIATFYGSTALYTNLIGLWVNGTQQGSWALNNHTSKFGDSVDFGHVNAGDTIVFALEVLTKGYFVSSDPSMNPDGINHVYTTSFPGETKKGASIAAGTFVAFEDLLMPHSNLNYNDEDVVFSNLVATAASTSSPEPSSLLLLGSGLGAVGFGILRRKRG